MKVSPFLYGVSSRAWSLLLTSCVSLSPLVSSAVSASEAITITSEVRVVNERSQVPMEQLGVHNVPMDEARVNDWGVTGLRRVMHNPTSATRIPQLGDKKILEERFEKSVDTNEKRSLRWQIENLPASNIEWVIDCFFDRYQPALQVTAPLNWEESLRKRVRSYVASARASGQQHFLEFWNEPYLNWAVNPAVNYSPSYYQSDGVQPGDPMVHKISGEVVPGLEWAGKRFYVVENGSINYVISGYIHPWAKPGEPTKLRYGAGTATLEDGGTVRIRNKDWTVRYGPWGKDSKQKHYWSGPVNVAWYNEMLNVVGDELAVLGAADEIPLAGGWGFNIFNENWDSWRYLIKPMIDTNHQWLDAIHEHHYGGDVRRVGMSYEVAYNYTQASYGKRLEFWNTEAGGHLDPQQPGNAATYNHGDPLTKARASMTYLLRDVIYQWAHVPDKARFRASHHSHHTSGGDPMAFRLLKPMVGEMMAIDNPYTDMWCVASTDDEATYIVVFNDSRNERQLPLSLPISKGEALVAQIETIDGKLQLVEETVDIEQNQLSLSIQPVSALRIRLPRIEPSARQYWHQFGAAQVLFPLNKTTPITISLPESQLHKTQEVHIRLVSDQSLEELELRINGVSFNLNNIPLGISDHPLPQAAIAALRTENVIEMSAAQGRMLSTSLWLRQ